MILRHRLFYGLQGLPRVVPVDVDVARLLYGPAKDGYAEKLPFCDELERDRQVSEEHGDVEGALVVRHEKIGGRREMLRSFDGDGDARCPEHGSAAHRRAIRCTRSPFGSNGADREGDAGEEEGGAYQVRDTRGALLIYASFSKAAMISSTSALIVGSMS